MQEGKLQDGGVVTTLESTILNDGEYIDGSAPDTTAVEAVEITGDILVVEPEEIDAGKEKADSVAYEKADASSVGQQTTEICSENKEK